MGGGGGATDTGDTQSADTHIHTHPATQKDDNRQKQAQRVIHRQINRQKVKAIVSYCDMER